MPIIFNVLAIGMLVAAFVVGVIAHLLFGKGSLEVLFESPVFLLAAGVVALGTDGVLRVGAARGAGKKRGLLQLIHPSGGGQLMFLPVWLWGLGLTGWGGCLGVAASMVRADKEQMARLRVREIPQGYRDLTFSTDGRLLAVSALFMRTEIWDTSTGLQVQKIDAQAESVAFSLDDRLLATTEKEKYLTLWEVAGGKKLREIRAHSGYRELAFSLDGKTLAVGDRPNLQLVDVETGNTLHSLDGWAPRFVPEGLVILSKTGVRLIDTTTGRDVKTLVPPQAGTPRALSTDGRRLVLCDNPSLTSGEAETHVKVVDVATARVVSAATLPTWCRGLSPDGRLLAGVMDRGLFQEGSLLAGELDYKAFGTPTIVLWNTDTLKEDRRFRGYAGSVGDIAFSPDGKVLASAAERALQFWSLAQ